ncbi:hypothetical protein [Micromonospora sp. DT47]|uniref:hypothetical protein n=1 Tax=Micromonospora sp. DT47 TaxID=3393431 RepID=UPI003CEA19B7
MPQPQPGADRPAEGSTPAPDPGRDPAATGEPPSPAVPSTAGPGTGPEGTRELPTDAGPAEAGATAEPAVPAGAPAPTTADDAAEPDRPAPTRVDPALPAPTRVDPPAPKWSGSAAVPPPPSRRPAWGESAEPTPVPPPPPHELPEHRTPVDPWAGVDTGGWEVDHPDLTPLPPTLPYPAPPPTRPYQAAPSPTRTYPAAPPPAVGPPPAPPVSPAPPPPPPARTRPSKQRRGRPEPVTPPPGWQAPRGYVPVPVRRRRRWPWVLLLTLACCCGCPAWFGQPMWEQYPANAALPGQVADLTLRQDARSRATVKRLETEVRQANLLAEDVFAGVYGTPDGKRATVFGGTGFRLNPESDADDEMTRLTETYRLGEAQPVDTGVRGRYERCAVGRADGGDVVVCTSVDYGSITTAVFTRLSVDDSARLLATLREQIITSGQA